MVLNLDGQVTIDPSLFEKAMEWCKVNKRVTQSREMIHDEVSQDIWLQDIQTSRSGREK